MSTIQSFFLTSGATQYKLWDTGGNTQGQLGLGDAISRSVLTQVGSLTDWDKVFSDGGGFFAIKTDKSLWTSGTNTSGRLGTSQNPSTVVSVSSPVQVGSLLNWSLVSALRNTVLSVKTDGTLWSWGLNDYGQLGLGDITDRSSPVQIGTGTNWAKCSVGKFCAFGIKTDGTLWAWGQAQGGQLGNSNAITNQSSPIQIGSLTDWAQISSGQGTLNGFSVAIKTDGTLWSWGDNGYGSLGLGDSLNRSSPVQIGALTTWASVSCGTGQVLAVKTDGTLWTWGNGANGRLGSGAITSRSSPVQVGTLTNWSLAFGGDNHSGAIKTDGTIWAWGFNAFGQLGQNNTTAYSSPVQIGTDSNWYAFDCRGGSQTYAISKN